MKLGINTCPLKYYEITIYYLICDITNKSSISDVTKHDQQFFIVQKRFFKISINVVKFNSLMLRIKNYIIYSQFVFFKFY